MTKKYKILRSPYQKYTGLKITPPPVVAVVTNMNYGTSVSLIFVFVLVFLDLTMTSGKL